MIWKYLRFWEYLETHEKKLDVIIVNVTTLLNKLETLDKKERQMAKELLDAIKALQEEVGDVVVAQKEAVDDITALVEELAAANDAGNVTAVNQAIADLKASTDALKVLTATVPAPEPQPEAPPTG